VRMRGDGGSRSAVAGLPETLAESGLNAYD
jgi:hypothetical protein